VPSDPKSNPPVLTKSCPPTEFAQMKEIIMKTQKTLYLLLGLALLISMALSACQTAASPAPTESGSQPGPAAEEPAAEPVTITYWHSMSNPETEQLTQVIAAFEAANPDVKVEATRYASDDDSFKQAMLTASAAGSYPDAARLDIAWVPQYANDGVLLQLDGAMPGFDELKASVFPGPLSTNFWNGHYYGLPLNTNTQVLLWNKAWFEEAGLSAAPKTMDEFAEVTCQLSDSANEKYGYAQGGTYFWAPAPVFYAMGGKFVDEEMTTATGYINGESSVAAYTLLKELYDQGCLSPNLMGGGIPTDAGHATGQYAMIVDGPWMVDIYKSNYPDFDVNFALIPAGPDGKSSSVVGGEDVVVFNTSENPEAAMKWLAYLLSPEAQKTMAEVGVMPTLTSLQGDPALPEYFGIFMEQLATAQARVPHPSWPQMDEAANQAYQRILRGDQTVQEALDQAAEEINALLK
jgi:multiple sugar transport system substrate-binding protein